MVEKFSEPVAGKINVDSERGKGSMVAVGLSATVWLLMETFVGFRPR